MTDSRHQLNDDTSATELPVMRLGLAGFSEIECQTIALGMLSPRANQPTWRIAPFQLADAWLLCGERSAPAISGRQDTLCVAAGLPQDRALTLILSEIDRPVAFSLPLGSTDIEAGLTFKVRSPSSLHAVLNTFERWLRPLLAKFTLGAQLMAREAQLQRVVYHVSCNGQLLAVLDFEGWKIGMLPEATPERLADALWEKRPSQAHDIPAHFVQSSVEQLRWIFGQHTTRNVLPKRYQQKVVYFAQPPNVPQTWLESSHLLLLRELSARPATVMELSDRCNMAPAELARDLACLYFAGSLTTTQHKAAAHGFSVVSEPVPKGQRLPRGETTIFNSTLPPDTETRLDHDITAPAGLQRE